MKKSKKIALVGTYYTESVGDALLFQCVKYLYRSFEGSLKLRFKIVDVNGRRSIKRNSRSRFGRCFQRILNKILCQLGMNNERPTSKDVKEEYYLRAFRDCDMVVVAGGGIFKYSVGTNFAPIFSLINKAALFYSIPVVYNAVGVEGIHDENSKEFLQMKLAFNSSVKAVSSRDNGNIINKYFDDTPIFHSQVADTGVWAKEAFNIEKVSNSVYVGLNPVAPFFFEMYGKKNTEAELLKLWVDAGKELLNRNQKIIIFSNGNDADYRFAKKIYNQLKYIGEERVLLVESISPKMMIRCIAKCKAIIASRLHTCICAYSLDIPIVGLAWNDKLINWGKTIKKESLFFDDVGDIDMGLIINHVTSEIAEPYDDVLRNELKASVAEFAKKAVLFLT